MHPPSTSTRLTVGKLLGLTIGLYRVHSGIFLRTAAIFYLPIAALSFFFVENIATNTLFVLLVWPRRSICEPVAHFPFASNRCTGVLLPSGQRSGVVCVACRLKSA